MSHTFRIWWQELQAREQHDAVHDAETPARVKACQARQADMLVRARAAEIFGDDPATGAGTQASTEEGEGMTETLEQFQARVKIVVGLAFAKHRAMGYTPEEMRRCLN